MKKSILIVTAGLLVAVMPAVGGPLIKSQISGAANWFVHADLEQFNKSRIGQLVRAEMENRGVEDKLREFAIVFSFHPLDDVRDVTVYGTGSDEEKGVVLVDGVFDRDKLLAMVRFSEEYEQYEYRDITLYRWLHKDKPEDESGKMMYGCFYGDDLMVMSRGLDAVKQAVDVLSGSAENANDMFNQPALQATGVFLKFAAYDVGRMAEQQPQAASLKQAEEMALVLGEQQGNIYAVLELKAAAEEAALNIRKVGDGILGFAALAGQEQPILAKLAEKVHLSSEDSTVRVRFEAESGSILSLLKEQEQWQKQQQEKEADEQQQDKDGSE